MGKRTDLERLRLTKCIKGTLGRRTMEQFGSCPSTGTLDVKDMMTQCSVRFDNVGDLTSVLGIESALNEVVFPQVREASSRSFETQKAVAEQSHALCLTGEGFSTHGMQAKLVGDRHNFKILHCSHNGESLGSYRFPVERLDRLGGVNSVCASLKERREIILHLPKASAGCLDETGRIVKPERMGTHKIFCRECFGGYIEVDSLGADGRSQVCSVVIYHNDFDTRELRNHLANGVHLCDGRLVENRENIKTDCNYDKHSRELRCKNEASGPTAVEVLVGAPTDPEERRSPCRYLLNVLSQLGPLN